MDGSELGTLGPMTYFNSGVTYYEFAAAPAFAEVKPVFDRVTQAWAEWFECNDGQEADRLYGLGEAAEQERAALALRLVLPEASITLADAMIQVHMEDSPPCLRVKLGKEAYETLRAAGFF